MGVLGGNGESRVGGVWWCWRADGWVGEGGLGEGGRVVMVMGSSLC